MRNTWITGQYTLIYLMNYNGNNGAICHLQMRIMMMHMDVVHRNDEFVIKADYGSRKGGDLWYDPLIRNHNAFAATLRKRFAPPKGAVEKCNMPGARWPKNKEEQVTAAPVLHDAHAKTWERVCYGAKCFRTTSGSGPAWDCVFRRVTIDLDKDEVIKDLAVDNHTSECPLHRMLPPGVSNIKTVLNYREQAGRWL